MLVGHLDAKTGRLRLAARGPFAWGPAPAGSEAGSEPGSEPKRPPLPPAPSPDQGEGTDAICQDEAVIEPGSVWRIASPGQLAASGYGELRRVTRPLRSRTILRIEHRRAG